MKIRSDFVSNSSSSSYIVAVDSRFSTDEFIAELCEHCIYDDHDDHDDHDYAKTCLEAKKSNPRNLQYHLNSTELLFLGRLRCADTLETYYNRDVQFPDNALSYNEYQSAMSYASECSDAIYIDDNKVTFAKQKFISNVAVPCSMMKYTFQTHYQLSSDSNDDNVKMVADDRTKRKLVQNVLKLVNEIDYNGMMSYYNSDLFMITQTTIDITRAMLEEGCQLQLADVGILDKFQKMLDDGDKLFGIKINQSGNGVDEMSIYAMMNMGSILPTLKSCKCSMLDSMTKTVNLV